MSEEKQAKTGTTTVAIVCKDGVILAADRRVTAGYVANKKYHKIVQITDKIAVTVAGTVSDVQLLSRLLKAELKLKDIQTGRISSTKEAANLLAGMVYNNFRKFSSIPGITGFLLAGIDEAGHHAYEIGIDGSVMDIEEYTSDGSGCVFALGVLETVYKKGMSMDEGLKVAIKSINAAIQRDTASGNGIDVLAVTVDGAKFIYDKDATVRLEA
ncbi:proteasome subunit beta [Candidatus Woesearchaeota archaeon]|nr:proteasome subunit beta [Candidatus Woesearchaeota archaeon]